MYEPSDAYSMEVSGIGGVLSLLGRFWNESDAAFAANPITPTIGNAVAARTNPAIRPHITRVTSGPNLLVSSLGLLIPAFATGC
jgi:hypothetical protein